MRDRKRMRLKRILPQLSFLVGGWNFYNARFVDYASGAIALFYYSYDPSLVSFLFLYVFAVGSRLFPRQAD